jgi:hypothetical protein
LLIVAAMIAITMRRQSMAEMSRRAVRDGAVAVGVPVGRSNV